MQIIDYGDYYKPNKPQPKPKAQYYEPPKPKPAAKKVLAQPVKPQMPPPTLPGQYPQPPKIYESNYYGWDDLWSDIGNWLRNIGKGGAPYQPPTLEYYQQLSGEKPVYEHTQPHGNTLGAPTPAMLAAASGQAPFQPNYSYYYPRSGAPANWQIAPIRGASRGGGEQPYNRQANGVSAIWSSNGASVPAISYVNRLQGAWNGAYLFPDIKSGYSTANPNANMKLPMLNPRITGVWNDEHPYPNQQAGYSTQTPTYPFPIVNPEPYGDLFDNVTYEDPGGGGSGGGGWGWGGGWGSTSYGASSGVNSYLPGTRAGYGANASSPRYTGGGGGRGSSYAGGQYANQAAWRMPMLVWNI